MLREDTIAAEGVIVEVLDGNLFRVELANQHRLMARLSRNRPISGAELRAGVVVQLELSPYDLSQGRIV